MKMTLKKTILYDVPDLNETVLYKVPADLLYPYANKESGDGGRGVTTNSRENEGAAKVGQPAGLHIPYANKDKEGDVGRGRTGDLGQSKEKAPVIDMGGTKADSGEEPTSIGMRRSGRARKIPARYRD